MVNDAPAMLSVSGAVARRPKILERAKADPKVDGGFVGAKERAVDARRPHALLVFRDVLGGHGAIAFTTRRRR